MCIPIIGVREEQPEVFILNFDCPAIVIDCGTNMRKAFRNIQRWDWLRCGGHLIHSFVTAGFTSPKNNAHNRVQTQAQKRQKALDRWKYDLLLPNAFFATP